MSIEQVSQTDMLAEFRERLKKLVEENQQYAAKIKENETVALNFKVLLKLWSITILKPCPHLLMRKQWKKRKRKRQNDTRGSNAPFLLRINNLEA